MGRAVGRVLADLGLDSASAAVRLASLWEGAVGEEIARHARPEALRKSPRGCVLEVRVDTSTWCQQLQLRREEILAGLRRVLGDDAPDDVRLRVG